MQLQLFAVFNPQKMKKWVDSLTQLKGYLDASGVGDQLEEVSSFF